MTRDDYDYYVTRAAQEDYSASISASDVARERHQEMADAYRFRCALLRQPSASERSGGGAMADYNRKTRQPIASCSTTVLAPRPAMVEAPLLRA